MSTCTTKKNSRRSDVWALFLSLREAGKRPILMDSAKGWSYVCVPAAVQPEFDLDLQGEFDSAECGFVGGWVGFFPYSGDPWFRFCDEVYAFDVAFEDSFVGPSFGISGFKSSLSKEEYLAKIEEIKRLLVDGETYQVNFAQEFLGEFSGDPFGLYCAMFMANPSDFCFYAEDGDFAVCSNSPERLISLRNGVMRCEPIKGTVGSGEDPEFLLSDEKSYAELTMIVDLMRNDLGKVAKLESVQVLEHQALMKLANVWHTYSVIEAELDDSYGAADMIKAVFPGGSVTGCPKKRTMEIISRLENFDRGAYCGSAGYISLNGNVDLNIMIRTATVRGGLVSFPSGGGIVMDSVGEDEYEETLKKASVIRGLTK